MPEEDSEARLRRREDGTVEPKKESAAQDTIELKLQDTTIVEKFAHFGEHFPMCGRNATHLLLTAAAERRSKKATKAVAMWLARCSSQPGCRRV